MFFFKSQPSGICFTSTLYPRVHGTPTGATSYFNAFDIDINGNIAVGGSSSAPTLVNSSNTPNPILVFYTPTGTIVWAKQFNNNRDSVEMVTFNPTGTQILIATDPSSSLSAGIIILDASNGSII